MNIEHISVSRSKIYKQCPQLYKFKYHLKIPNPGPEQFYFTYGKIVHKIAEVYIQEKAARSLAEIRTDVLRGKIEIEKDKVAPPLPKEYSNKLTSHLRSIQTLTEQIGTDGLLEYQFRYDLEPPHEKFVTGFIDRLILKGDKAYIIDYKTTKKGPFRETNESIVYDLQLRCYARVVQKEFGIDPKNILGALLYVDGGQLVPTRFNEASVMRAEQELLNCYNEIKQADPDRVWGKTGMHCNRCEYNQMCPFYKSAGGRSAPAWDGDMSNI